MKKFRLTPVHDYNFQIDADKIVNLYKHKNFYNALKTLIDEIVNNVKNDDLFKNRYQIKDDGYIWLDKVFGDLLTINKRQFDHVNFTKMTLIGCKLEELTFTECSFEDLVLVGARINNVNFINCIFKNIEMPTHNDAQNYYEYEDCESIWKSNINNTRFDNCNFDDISVPGVEFNNCEFNQIDLIKSFIGTDKHNKPAYTFPPYESTPSSDDYDETQNNNIANLWMEYYVRNVKTKFSYCEFVDTSFTDTNLSHTDFGLSRFTNSKFKDCKYYMSDFNGCAIDENTDFDGAIVLPSELREHLTFIKLNDIDSNIKRLYDQNENFEKSISITRDIVNKFDQQLISKILSFTDNTYIIKRNDIDCIISTLTENYEFMKVLDANIIKVLATACYIIEKRDKMPSSFDFSTAILCFDKSVQMAFYQYFNNDKANIKNLIAKKTIITNGHLNIDDLRKYINSNYQISTARNMFYFFLYITNEYTTNIKFINTINDLDNDYDNKVKNNNPFFFLYEKRNGYIHKDYCMNNSDLLLQIKRNSIECIKIITMLMQ